MTLWFLARAAGFVALLTASLTVTLGAAGTSSRGDARIVGQLVHRSAAVVTLAMLALHALLLVTDRYVDLSLGGALVPFTAGYRSLALGLGTLALYAFVVVAATGALRGRLAAGAGAARTWRAVHLTAYGAWALAMAHGLLAGTDTHTSWAALLYAGSAVVVAAVLAARLASAVRERRSALTAARHTATHRRIATTAGGPR